ncbi:NitT/TauT family transport system substrate-binding protein [Rhodoligotrophos appendicifer]|uniref:ABC transporter substrate-binding protein n=1 Tax=Rhodoligotrophos appendicifer TaxID=987056 RepID=UPI001FEAD359|nr:ABC transporter substrate-binding protein [Rhodoligotrophos appendicifer]
MKKMLMRVLVACLAVSAVSAVSVTAMAQEVVRITNIGRGYFAGPLYIAMREGLFEKHGLKPEVTFVKGGSLAFQSVFNRDVEFGILSYEHVLTGTAQGRKLVSVFNVTDRPLNNIVVNNELYEANKDKSIAEKVLALKGAKVGTPSAGGSGEKMLGVLARQHGLDLPKDVELVYLGTEAASYVGAFQTKTINAAMPFEPAGVVIKQRGLGNTLVDLMNGEVEQFRDLIFMTLVTHPSLIAEKPELVRKVVEVFVEAQQILLDPERGPKIMGAEFSTMDPDANQQAYDVVKQIWSKDGRMTLAGGKKVFEYLQPKGDEKINFEETFTNEFLPKQ